MTEDIRRKDVVDSDGKSRGMQDRAEYDMAHRRSAGRIDQGLAHRTFTTVCAGTDVVHGVDAIEHLGIAVDVAEIRGAWSRPEMGAWRPLPNGSRSTPSFSRRT